MTEHVFFDTFKVMWHRPRHRTLALTVFLVIVHCVSFAAGTLPAEGSALTGISGIDVCDGDMNEVACGELYLTEDFHSSLNLLPFCFLAGETERHESILIGSRLDRPPAK